MEDASAMQEMKQFRQNCAGDSVSYEVVRGASDCVTVNSSAAEVVCKPGRTLSWSSGRSIQ